MKEDESRWEVDYDGDWKDFVIINFADLMVEKKSEDKESEREENEEATA